MIAFSLPFPVWRRALADKVKTATYSAWLEPAPQHPQTTGSVTRGVTLLVLAMPSAFPSTLLPTAKLLPTVKLRWVISRRDEDSAG